MILGPLDVLIEYNACMMQSIVYEWNGIKSYQENLIEWPLSTRIRKYFSAPPRCERAIYAK